MKKIFLTGTALLAFAAASLAQTNTATYNQNGTNQTGQQTQTGNYLQSAVNQTQGAATNVGNFAATQQTSIGSGRSTATTWLICNRRAYATQQRSRRRATTA